MHGLQNKRIAKALENENLKDLDAAYAMVKREVKKDGGSDVERCNIVVREENELEKLKAEIRYLKEQISSLNQTIRNLYKGTSNNYSKQMNNTHGPFNNTYYNSRQQNPIQSNVFKRRSGDNSVPQGFNNSNYYNTNRSRECYNCLKEGHIARDCKSPVCCRICRGAHKSFICPQRQRKPIRNLWETQDGTDFEETTSSTLEDMKDALIEQNEIHSASINIIQRKRARYQKCKESIRTDIDDLCDYVNGKIPNKPRNYAETLISKHHAEKAANKPLVDCNSGSKRCRILFDTGAEANLVDWNTLEELMSEDGTIPYVEKKSFVKCANGSLMKVRGFTLLDIRIGSSVARIRFMVVDNLFPRFIIGIRSMKKEQINVIPEEDAIRIKGEKVDFVSRVQSKKTNDHYY